MRVSTEKGLVVIPDHMVVETFPDSGRYQHRFTVNSASSDAKYMISYDSAKNAGYWKCSCRGNIRHGSCKHLTSLNLVTRQDIMTRRLGSGGQ
jgi:hypothetical protein